MLRFFKTLLYGCFIIGFVTTAFWGYQLYQLVALPMPNDGKVIILEIKPNSTATSLANILYSKQLISSKSLFLYWVKYKHLASHLKTGFYNISANESAGRLLYRIAEGDVLSQSFRIIDGSNWHQIDDNLKKAPYLHYNDNPWTLIATNHISAEGLLLADTYQYVAGSDASELLLTANKKLNNVLESCWQTRDAGLPYKNAYDMLIAASILEKETAIPAERNLIAGVIVNRLQKNMPLQMDPTVIYALGANYTGKLSHRDLSVDSPYNTYRYRRLPPTPIAMVGKAAIEAAAHPQPSNYLYFVAKGDGSHQFSETYADQKKAISRYVNQGL